MPKHKNKHKDYDEIRRKIRKLERSLRRAGTRSRSRSSRSAYTNRDRNYDSYYEHSESETKTTRYESENSLDGELYGDFPGYISHEEDIQNIDPNQPGPTQSTHVPTASPDAVVAVTTGTALATAPPTISHTIVSPTETGAEDVGKQTTDTLQKEIPLDDSILEILGADPSNSVEYGKEIRQELASRLEHIATSGLSKEVRQELLEKYLIPANCTKINAPLMNAEIKAAVTEIITKRDRGIEHRQKQLASAISGLANIINSELESSEKDNVRLKQLMDVSRLLCDLQHSESVTRRNFAIYSIKKDLKEHITDAKIDKYLFGEGLAETLKTAKAVSKSGTDLKVKHQAKAVKPFNNNYNSSPSNNNLNWRAPAPARRQQGPQRSREPAYPATSGPPARHSRTPRHSYSSKTSQHPQRQHRRR